MKILNLKWLGIGFIILTVIVAITANFDRVDIYVILAFSIISLLLSFILIGIGYIIEKLGEKNKKDM